MIKQSTLTIIKQSTSTMSNHDLARLAMNGMLYKLGDTLGVTLDGWSGELATYKIMDEVNHPEQGFGWRLRHIHGPEPGFSPFDLWIYPRSKDMVLALGDNVRSNAMVKRYT